MKSASILILALASTCLLRAQSDNMRSEIGSMLRQDAKAYAKAQADKKPETKPAKPAQKPAAPADKAMELPKYQVKARPFAKESPATFDARKLRKANDKQIAREEKATHATDEDKLLNNKKTSIMGGLTAQARADDARVRIQQLQVKNEVLGTIVDPKDDKENKELLDELNDLEVAKHYQ